MPEQKQQLSNPIGALNSPHSRKMDLDVVLLNLF